MLVLFSVPVTIFGLPLSDLKRLGYEEQRKSRGQHSDLGEVVVEKFASKKAKRYQRELLGQLSKDLDYLEVLSSEVKLKPGSSGANEARGRRMKEEADEAISFLRNRQLFWSQFKPMYSNAN